MSRIGKKPILIPEGVEIKIQGRKVIVKGLKGELSQEIPFGIKIEIKDNKIFTQPFLEKGLIETKQVKAFWGLTRALLANMVEGVSRGFEKKLEIQGIGFKAIIEVPPSLLHVKGGADIEIPNRSDSDIEGEELILNVGFSHPVKIKIPQDLKISVEKNIIIVSGIDKGLVGQISAVIRRIKPPEPYKGKGIRYLGEQVRRKAGKRVTK